MDKGRVCWPVETSVSRLSDHDCLPEDIDPFTEDTWRADTHMDLCVPESAEDRERWRQVGIDFKARWEHLFFKVGSLRKRQAS
jgi:hypothetical protein